MSRDISIIESLEFSLGTIDVQKVENLSALKNHYIQQIKEHNFAIDKVYFSGEFPSIYFKKVTDFEASTQSEILSIHKSIWNQGKVPFLYVESPTEVRIYNCYEKPVKDGQEDRTISDLELYQTSLDDLSELKRVFDKVSIETGRFWKEKKYAQQLKNESRVEEELIKNLKKTRVKLLESELPISTIHDLLLRSLFILYLEDRKATDANFYQKITGLEDVTSYFQILENKPATYKLFAELDDKFNGNLSPIKDGEENEVTAYHLSKIKDCFWAEIREDGQLKLFDWRLFDFEVIPIQLLSEIYEEFLGAEDKVAKTKAGAFYTPHPLAEFVLNEVLPHPTEKDSRYNIKILDPTCGSGIFLVESLNRLLDRWEMAHSKETLTFEIICKIVEDNIFGIEINPEAIKVAAFSLYLAMLNRLNPKTLWQNKRFPYLIYDPSEENEDKQGNNLFRMSSLGRGLFEEIEFELVVGNPPFGRGGLEKEEQNYLDKRNYARELVLAFLDRVITLAPYARYGLICASKPVLFNNGSRYQSFRKFLFNATYVDKVYNFSILRRGVKKEGGRNLFASAVSPISVIFYSRELPPNPSPKIMYCAPKTALKNRLIDGIAVDKTDIKYLPREECQKPDTKIWKIAMWGTERDFRLLNNLFRFPSIEDFLNLKQWEKGGGFQTSKPKDEENFQLRKFPHIGAKYLERYFTNKNKTESIEITKFERLGTLEAYKAPHILIKEGQKDKRFCASYLDYNCSFRKTIYGIHSKESQDLKTLMAFLNSGLAFYIMFLTTADWGVERERVEPKEIMQLPSLNFILKNSYKSHINHFIDKIIQIKKSNLLEEDQLIAELEQKIENTLWDALNFSEAERILIEDLLNFNLDAFQNKQKSIAYKPCRLDENNLYAKYLCKTINEFLDYGEELTVWASVFSLSPRIPLNAIILHLNKDQEADTIIELPEKQIGQILKQMEEHTYKKHAESIYYRRFLRYYTDDKLYIIKPNEKRLWSRAMAMNDADEIIAEILND